MLRELGNWDRQYSGVGWQGVLSTVMAPRKICRQGQQLRDGAGRARQPESDRVDAETYGDTTVEPESEVPAVYAYVLDEKQPA